MKEMQRVRLQNLAEMQQAAELFSGRREPLHADKLVHRLGRRQLMTDRADPAQALHYERHFAVRAALNEFFEAAKLDDVETCLVDMIFFIQQQRDLAVPLDPRDGIDSNTPERRFGLVVLFHVEILSIVMQQVLGEHRFFSFQQVAEHLKEFICRRRATRQVKIHMHHVMQRMHFV